MTRVLILGAYGQLARHTTPFFLDRTDAHITLYLRRAGRLSNPDAARMTLIEGAVSDRMSLRAAMQGHDVVVATLAGATMSAQAEEIVEAMQATGVTQLIFCASMSVHGEVLSGETFHSVLDGYRDAAVTISRSGLDYTILRSDWFTQYEAIGYRLAPHKDRVHGQDVSLNRLSDLIVKLAMSRSVEARRMLEASHAMIWDRCAGDDVFEPAGGSPLAAEGSREPGLLDRQLEETDAVASKIAVQLARLPESTLKSTGN